VQIFVDGECHVRRVGDANRLIDNPTLIPPSSTLSFLEWMRQQIEDANVTNGTKSNHRNCLRHLMMFREDITFADLDYRLVCAFDRHLRAMKLKINTIAKLMKVWHRYINIAISEDLLIADPFRKYTIRRESTRKDTLSEREMKRVEKNVDNLPDNERNVVRAFLFSCYTGLRFSDLCRVKGSDVRTNGKQKWLIMRTQKTGAEVHVPLSVAFNGKGVSMVENQGTLFHLPNNARCNVLLKRAMKHLHVRKKLSMHCGRVTCATICLLRGVPLSTIQHVLGHRSINTTASVYAQVLDNTISRSMRRAWRA
jgi:site-specific recombinase XerD